MVQVMDLGGDRIMIPAEDKLWDARQMGGEVSENLHSGAMFSLKLNRWEQLKQAEATPTQIDCQPQVVTLVSKTCRNISIGFAMMGEFIEGEGIIESFILNWVE